MNLGLPQIVVLLIAAQRVAELIHARRNTARLRAAGGVEHGARHYPLFVLLHTAWLVAVFAAVPAGAPVSWPLLALYAMLQPLRLWVLGSLGRFWTTRVIVVPGTDRVREGPYRFVRHPNYLIVLMEIPLLPMAFGAWEMAAGFGIANASLIAWRLHVEERAFAAIN